MANIQHNSNMNPAPHPPKKYSIYLRITMYIYIYIHIEMHAYTSCKQKTHQLVLWQTYISKGYIYICYVCSGKNIGTLPTITIITMSFSWCSMGARPFYYSTNQRENIPVYIYITGWWFQVMPPKKINVIGDHHPISIRSWKEKYLKPPASGLYWL